MKVLLGIAGDERSMEALSWAIDRANSADDDLTVALVDRPGREVDREASARSVRERLEAAGLDPDLRTPDGQPGTALVGLADREEFDMLVIHGKEPSPMGKIELDHVEEYVLLNARTSVTILR